MAGKRQATSNLNHENWDQEDEPEERGTFKSATAEELKSRVIKKATRRKAISGECEAGDAGTSSAVGVFSGFSGFGTPSTASTASKPFAFLADAAKATGESPKPSTAQPSTAPFKKFMFDSNLKNDLPTNTLTSITPATAVGQSGGSIFGNSLSAGATKLPQASVSVSMFQPTVSVEKTTKSVSVTPQYRDSVAELNMAVMKFLQEHMDKNPYCILTPVFDSYDKYLNELKQLDSAKPDQTKSPETKATATATTTATAITTETAKATTTTEANAAPPTAAAASFSFGMPITTTDTGGTSTGLSFGKKPNCTVTSGGTTTTVTAPFFSFGNVQKPVATATKTDVTSTSSAAAPEGLFSFGIKSQTTEGVKESPPKTNFFSFGNKDATAADSAAAPSPPKTNGFSFGMSSEIPSTSGFMGFGKPAGETKMPPPSITFPTPAKPFSFGILKPPSDAAASTSAADGAPNDNAEGDEEDQPPKVEFKQVVEADAIFSKRCKVFVKKDKDFVDRGVGTLYLKPIKDSAKTQLLVRADTNLGNILINTLLSEGQPSQRMGKNNVLLMCVPNPEDTKATSVLLRVKTGEEADELLEQIVKHSV